MLKPMNDKKKRTLTLFVTALLVVTCLSVTAEGTDAADSDKTYGAAKEFSWTEVEKISQELIGKSVEELLMELSENEYGYKLLLTEPHFEGKMATKRDVKTAGNVESINDHVSAYMEFGTVITIQGNLPDAGTYQRLDGEDSKAFLDRILKDHASKESREVTLELLYCVYADVNITTRINTITGEMMGNDLQAKLFVVEYEKSNISIETEEEEDELNKITISYKDEESFGNFYLSVDMGLLYDGMKIFSNESSWTFSPKITTHINHIFVSSDMASGVWNMVKQVAGIDGMINERLPALILNIVKSGSRVLDLVETIKSLTGKSIRDIDFLATIEASNVEDEAGREYVEMKVKHGDGNIQLKFPKLDYSLTASDILGIVPSYILSDEVKLIIEIGLAVIGWDDIEVSDMDEKMEKKFEEVYDHTNTMIEYDEEYELNIPLEYIIMSIVGLIGCIAAVILIRRRSA